MRVSFHLRGAFVCQCSLIHTHSHSHTQSHFCISFRNQVSAQEIEWYFRHKHIQSRYRMTATTVYSAQVMCRLMNEMNINLHMAHTHTIQKAIEKQRKKQIEKEDTRHIPTIIRMISCKCQRPKTEVDVCSSSAVVVLVFLFILSLFSHSFESTKYGMCCFYESKSNLDIWRYQYLQRL